MKKSALIIVILCFVFALHAQNNALVQARISGNRFILENNRIRLTLTFTEQRIKEERLTARPGTTHFFKGQQPAFKSNVNFALNVNWTGWRAPHKINNGENPVILTSEDFLLTNFKERTLQDGGKQLDLFFKGASFPLNVRLSYRLLPDRFWISKQLAIIDTTLGSHFLRFIYPSYSFVPANVHIQKNGGFGQPVVLRNGDGGFFCGLEYPAATNTAQVTSDGRILLQCGLAVGQKIGAQWLTAPWLVMALTPVHFERLWFDRYLNSQRVHPLRPYILYNSWYDLRSPAFKNIPPKNIMNEQNVLRIIDLIEKNFVRKNGIHLDAFVLDDGWDVYASDWMLRPRQFPHGLKPIADRLKRLNTVLGLWFGPTGGYSFRMQRIHWMQRHGYEVVGKENRFHNAMMCVAGKNYSQLLKKRTTDFVKNGVGFFKWDGIQFSCSEPGHGHPIGLYSQRAVMDTVIALCNAVRKVNPNTFLNITSGTWLSPWWVKYADQIWMGGGDYGYSDIPSISRRDAAITYRDITLFQDFNVRHFWFPISNLMTHGIIKGELQKLGGEHEPLDKFTNNALLYFARGVSMWELYISPDILNDAEWKAIGQSIIWARHNFDILKHTFMLGGNPAQGNMYAYVHFNGSRGIIALRNPFIDAQSITIPLSDTLGLAADADHLVLEQIYPVRWISPKLFKAGDQIQLKAEGYQTAVYQIFPIKKAQRPLPANLIFTAKKKDDYHYQINALASTGPLTMLNPNFSRSLMVGDKKVERIKFKIPSIESGSGVQFFKIRKKKNGFNANLKLNPETTAQMAILLQRDQTNKVSTLPSVRITVNGDSVQPRIEKQGGKWSWIKLPIKAKTDKIEVALKTNRESVQWQGSVQVWLLTDQQMPGMRLVFKTRKPIENEILPPLPRAANVLHKNHRLAKFRLVNGMLFQ